MPAPRRVPCSNRVSRMLLRSCFVDLSVSLKLSNSTIVDILEKNTQQPVAGCVTIAGGGGDSVATMDAFRETQAVSMCPGGGDDAVTLGLLARA